MHFQIKVTRSASTSIWGNINTLGVLLLAIRLLRPYLYRALKMAIASYQNHSYTAKNLCQITLEMFSSFRFQRVRYD